MIFFLSIFTLTGWIYLVFVHGKYKGYKKNTAFWTNKVIFEQEDFIIIQITSIYVLLYLLEMRKKI